MQTVPDKSQKPAKATGTCPRCLGAKQVKTANGTSACPVCRGTGEATKGYMTK